MNASEKLAYLKAELKTVEEKEIPYCTNWGGKAAYRRACARRDKLDKRIRALEAKGVK